MPHFLVSLGYVIFYFVKFCGANFFYSKLHKGWSAPEVFPHLHVNPTYLIAEIHIAQNQAICHAVRQINMFV